MGQKKFTIVAMPNKYQRECLNMGEKGHQVERKGAQTAQQKRKREEIEDQVFEGCYNSRYLFHVGVSNAEKGL